MLGGPHTTFPAISRAVRPPDQIEVGRRAAGPGHLSQARVAMETPQAPWRIPQLFNFKLGITSKYPRKITFCLERALLPLAN